MNNGNLLNSLLSFSGAPGVNAGTGKSSPAKTRVDINEQFRDALAQARPEVAAPKPAGRKPAAATNEGRQPAEHGNKAKPAPAAHREREPLRNDVARKTAPGDAITKSRSSESAAADEKSIKQDTESVEATAAGEAVIDPSTQTSTHTTVNAGLSLSPELNLELGEELSGDAFESDPLNGDLLESDALLAANPETLLAGTIPLTPLATDGSSNAQLTGNVATSALSIATSGTESTPGLNIGTLTEQPAATLSAINGAASNNSAGNLALEPGEDILGLADAVDETTIDVAGDNPDFLLLSGKAALGKLMDASATNEKALDPAKPLITPTALTEPLARLAEAQSPAARSFVVQTGVPVSVGQPQWSQAVGEKVLWLAAQNVSSAEIRLDPPDLGQLHVKVSVNQDQASVSFTSPHPMVREALDQQLNRLREMFSEQGLNLVNVDVSDRSSPQQDENAGQGKHAGASAEGEDDEVTPGVMTSIVSSRLVDHYA